MRRLQIRLARAPLGKHTSYVSVVLPWFAVGLFVAGLLAAMGAASDPLARPYALVGITSAGIGLVVSYVLLVVLTDRKVGLIDVIHKQLEERRIARLARLLEEEHLSASSEGGKLL